MRIAFYAPLKPPDHPVPSGDRRLARLFLRALRLAGHQPFVASRLCSYDGMGDVPRQARLAAEGAAAAEELLHAWRRSPADMPELWFTYHLYEKAPDWLGPRIAAALGIPYVVAEASSSPKRRGGAWDTGYRAVGKALARADLVLGLNPRDRECVLPLLATPQRWVMLPPIIDASAYRPARRSPTGQPRLITVAMMRPGDKLASYRLLGEALASLRDLDWVLDIVGDGAARPAVADALTPIAARVTYRGALDDAGIAGALAAADLFIWPAVNEAFGMALLEAQAAGLPVIAGASGGVGAVVEDGTTGLLTPPGDAMAFASAIRQLIGDDAARARMGAAARGKVESEHDLPVAAGRLQALLARLDRVRAA